MGVYCEVSMCVVADAPLSATLRAGIVELAVQHELLSDHCELSVPLPPRGIVDRVKKMLGMRKDQFHTVEAGAPGPWLGERVRAVTTEFCVCGRSPRMNGNALTGPFVYRVSSIPQPVKIGNARTGARSPHDPPDGVIGRFYDVMTLDAKRDLDGRIAARSGFIRDVKKLTNTKVICRASWY